MGDPRAGETATELEFETMDGGFPGNSVAREIREQVAEAVSEHVDEAAELVERHNPLSYWDYESLALFGDELADRAVPDARSLDAATRLVTLLDEGPLDADSPAIRELIDTIAENSIQGTGELMLLGRWTPSRQSGYVGDAHLGGATYFETNPGVGELFQTLPDNIQRELFWQINERVLETQEASGVTFAHTLQGFQTDQVLAEVRAIDLLAEGDGPAALAILQEADLASGGLPFRMMEAQWLLARGYSFEVDLQAEVVRWFRP
jgi:hypothetical protein